VVVTPQIDVGVDVTGTAEDDLVDRGPRKLSDAIQQVELVQDGNGLTGEGVPADLVPGEPLSVQEQRPQPAAAGEEGGSRAGWATAHDDEIVHLVVGVAHVLFGGRIGREDEDSKARGWSQWRRPTLTRARDTAVRSNIHTQEEESRSLNRTTSLNRTAMVKGS